VWVTEAQRQSPDCALKGWVLEMVWCIVVDAEGLLSTRGAEALVGNGPSSGAGRRGVSDVSRQVLYLRRRSRRRTGERLGQAIRLALNYGFSSVSVLEELKPED